MLEAAGAPIDQGRAQGRALSTEIEQALCLLRGRFSGFDWLESLWRSRRGPGRSLAAHLPQQHERLQGIADGAGASLAALELFESRSGVSAVGGFKGAELEASLDLPEVLGCSLALRHSVPDAGGWPSIELCSAPGCGALAGVNEDGLAVVCLSDRGVGQPSVRLLVQDLLFRSRALEPALEHLQRRAAYLGGSGSLLLLTKEGARQVTLQSGRATLSNPPERVALALEPSVRIDCAQRSLLWRDPSGTEHTAHL